MENTRLFPNPFQNEITFTKKTPNTKIECFDVFGKTVTVVKNGKSIDTKKLTSGVYFFKVSTESGSRLFKMLKK